MQQAVLQVWYWAVCAPGFANSARISADFLFDGLVKDEGAQMVCESGMANVKYIQDFLRKQVENYRVCV